MDKMTPGGRTARYETRWDPDSKLLISRLSGHVDYADVDAWEKTLWQATAAMAVDTAFKFYLDENGYQPANDAVHGYKRDVIPRFLAAHGLILSVLSSEDARRLRQTVTENTQGIRCIAMAMNHHDAEKMQHMDDTCGTANQRYFSDGKRAMQWIQAEGN